MRAISIYKSKLSKSISLLLKISIILAALGYITHGIFQSSTYIQLSLFTDDFQYPFLVLAILLVLVNSSIEAVKWKYLLRNIERLSFVAALKSTFSGIAIGMFTPNRSGDFVGRIVHLDKKNRIKAVSASFVGGGTQFAVTLFCGSLAMWYYSYYVDITMLSLLHSFDISVATTSILIVIVAALAYFWSKLIQIARPISSLFTRELVHVFLLSLFRYLVFTTQFYFLLRSFGVDIGLVNSYVLIALSFFLSSLAPTFSVAEVIVRSASSALVFSLIVNNTAAVVASSMLLWIINLGIPALIGGLLLTDIAKIEND